MADTKRLFPNEIDVETETRKREHIETVLNTNVTGKGIKTGFEDFSFEHCALPELDLDNIDLSTSVFGKSLQAPILISSMTGGASEGGIINTVYLFPFAKDPLPTFDLNFSILNTDCAINRISYCHSRQFLYFLFEIFQLVGILLFPTRLRLSLRYLNVY